VWRRHGEVELEVLVKRHLDKPVDAGRRCPHGFLDDVGLAVVHDRVAPAACASAAFSGPLTVATTCPASSKRASSIAAWPTAPAPPRSARSGRRPGPAALRQYEAVTARHSE